MASRYHWVAAGGGSGGWSRAASSIVKSTTLPVNSTLKKSVLHGVFITGRDTGIGYPGANTVGITQTLALSASSYGNRQLYYAGNALPMCYTGFYDNSTLQRVYSAIYWGGDNEFGHDQSMSYGGPGKTPGTLTLTLTWQSNGPLTTTVGGSYTYSWDILYYL